MDTPPPQYIQVTAALIQLSGRLFIAQHPSHKTFGLLWEFPGGKLKAGETPEEALVREFREELELSVVCEDKIALIKHSYTSFRVTLHAYLCRPLKPSGAPVLHAAVDSRWVTPSQLNDYPFPAANARLIKAISDRESRVAEGGRKKG